MLVSERGFPFLMVMNPSFPTFISKSLPARTACFLCICSGCRCQRPHMCGRRCGSHEVQRHDNKSSGKRNIWKQLRKHQRISSKKLPYHPSFPPTSPNQTLQIKTDIKKKTALKKKRIFSQCFVYSRSTHIHLPSSHLLISPFWGGVESIKPGGSTREFFPASFGWTFRISYCQQVIDVKDEGSTIVPISLEMKLVPWEVLSWRFVHSNSSWLCGMDLHSSCSRRVHQL